MTVTGASAELVNTQTPAVVTTLTWIRLPQIPTPTRNVLNAVTYLVGVNQTGVARGNATVNGLPESFLNITLDGVSNNDTFNKSTDAFFAPVRPRQDAIEAVSVTSAARRRGRRRQRRHLHQLRDALGHQHASAGSAYEYFRHPDLNSNYWFNERDRLTKNDVRLNQFGARQGGPIVIPGLYDGRGKAFFFVHYEQMELPNSVSRIAHAAAPAGAGRLVPLQRVVGGVTRSAKSTCSIWREPTASSRRPIRSCCGRSQAIRGIAADHRRHERVERSAAGQTSSGRVSGTSGSSSRPSGLTQRDRQPPRRPAPTTTSSRTAAPIT